MKYWKRWVADIQAKTAALSLLERGAYTELLDFYYIEGKPITGDHGALYRICRAFDKHERDAIDKVLGLYFHKTELGLYMNHRAQEELERADEYSNEQRQRSLLGVQARWGKKEKKTPPAKVNGHKFTPPEWIELDQWNAWVAIRPAKARTDASLAAACAKLEKFKAQGQDPNAIVANSLANGWQGLFPPDKKDLPEPSLLELLDKRDAEVEARRIADAKT